MIWENIELAFSSLKSNKMRALLTMLGIIIGIMSIITIMIIGDAMKASVTENLGTLGTNNITVSVQEKSKNQAADDLGDTQRMMMVQMSSRMGTGKKPESEDMISDQMIAAMMDYFPSDIQGVSLSYSGGSAKVQDGELYANVSINGTNQDYFTANNLDIISGRLISNDDVKEYARTAVVSDKLVSKIFIDGSDPIGRQIKLYKPSVIEVFTVVGVYKYEANPVLAAMSTASEEDMATSLYIPVTTAKQDLLEKNYTSMTVIGKADRDVNVFTSNLQNYFDDIYKGNEDWKLSSFNMTSMLDTVTNTLNTISIAIAFIAGISLLVGGIGVMNIMLVSVTERTREIGTRKALGAKNYHIRIQFVTEASIIALVGGIIGMLLGIALGAAAAAIFSVPLVISPIVILGSMAFSMIIGIFFGIYPANKAAKLDPIEALRYE